MALTALFGRKNLYAPAIPLLSPEGKRSYQNGHNFASSISHDLKDAEKHGVKFLQQNRKIICTFDTKLKTWNDSINTIHNSVSTGVRSTVIYFKILVPLNTWGRPNILWWVRPAQRHGYLRFDTPWVLLHALEYREMSRLPTLYGM